VTKEGCVPIEHDVVGIDPGTEVTAWVRLDHKCRCVKGHGIESNEAVLGRILEWQRLPRSPRVAIEMIESFGMPVGKEIFETVWWIGRYCQADQDASRVTRREVKLHVCGQMRGVNDSTIRQAMLDRYGPGREKAVGKKKSPGPLYGIRKDEWQALALAVTFFDCELTSSDSSDVLT
jgi:hypothetical protein